MNSYILSLQIIYTSIMSGMMLMYVITLGSYFDYILKNNMLEAIQDYSQFRKNTRVQIYHSITLIGQVIISVASLIINYDLGPFSLVFSVMVSLIMLVCHLLTGFGKVEQSVLSAKEINEKTVKVYLTWNKPLHITYTILYMISSVLLLRLI